MSFNQYILKPFLGIFLLSLFCSINLVAQITATTTVDKDSIGIGEQFALEITLEKPEGIEVEWPRLLGNVGDFEIAKFTPITAQTADGITTEKQTIHLTIFDEGFFTVPGLKFFYRQNNSRRQTQTQGIMVSVGTVEVDPAQAFKSIKPLEKVDVPFMDYVWYYLKKYKWIWLLSLLGLIGLGAFFYWRSQQKDPEYIPPPVVIPPHETAIRKLKELEREKLWQEGKVKNYYVELTEILREYVENRFEVPALESTTDEIMEGLADSPVNPSLSDKLKVLLNEADLVKFAKAIPEENMHKQRMKDAMVFVQHTKNLGTPEVETVESEV